MRWLSLLAAFMLPSARPLRFEFVRVGRASLRASKLLEGFSPRDADPCEYFFVDTGFVQQYLGGVRQQRGEHAEDLMAFVERPGRSFFYTETVARQLGKDHADASQKTSSAFICVDSGIFPHDQASLVTDLVQSLQSQALVGDVGALQQLYTDELMAVMEAGKVCFRQDLVPYLAQPLFISSRPDFYQTFLASEAITSEWEDLVNLYGFEHLIEAILLDDVLALAVGNDRHGGSRSILDLYIEKYYGQASKQLGL